MAIFKKERSIAFSDVIKGLQHAVNSAQEMLQYEQINNIKKYFDENGKAQTFNVDVGGVQYELPLIAIVPQCHLEMDEIEVKFKANANTTGEELPVIHGIHGENVTHADLNMQLEHISMDDQNLMDITVKFKTKESTEGLQRIIDEFNKHIF